MTQWEKALDELKVAATASMHSDWCNYQAKIIKDFIATTEAYIRQVERDYDELNIRNRNE